MGSAPCDEDGRGGADCVVVGTTARRVVLLGIEKRTSSGPTWLPRSLLQDDHAEVPEPGAFALLGGRYLGALQRRRSLLQVMDLRNGGAHVGTWMLPRPGGGKNWGSICADSTSFYALEDKRDPALWRFAAPAELSADAGEPQQMRREEMETSWPGMGWFTA